MPLRSSDSYDAANKLILFLWPRLIHLRTSLGADNEKGGGIIVPFLVYGTFWVHLSYYQAYELFALPARNQPSKPMSRSTFTSATSIYPFKIVFARSKPKKRRLSSSWTSFLWTVFASALCIPMVVGTMIFFEIWRDAFPQSESRAHAGAWAHRLLWDSCSCLLSLLDMGTLEAFFTTHLFDGCATPTQRAGVRPTTDLLPTWMEPVASRDPMSLNNRAQEPSKGLKGLITYWKHLAMRSFAVIEKFLSWQNMRDLIIINQCFEAPIRVSEKSNITIRLRYWLVIESTNLLRNLFDDRHIGPSP